MPPRRRPPPCLYFSSFALYYTQYLHTYLPAYIANYYSRSTLTETDLGNNLRGFDTRHFSGKPALLIRTRICYLLLRLSQHPANEEVFFSSLVETFLLANPKYSSCSIHTYFTTVTTLLRKMSSDHGTNKSLVFLGIFKTGSGRENFPASAGAKADIISKHQLPDIRTWFFFWHVSQTQPGSQGASCTKYIKVREASEAFLSCLTTYQLRAQIRRWSLGEKLACVFQT